MRLRDILKTLLRIAFLFYIEILYKQPQIAAALNLASEPGTGYFARMHAVNTGLSKISPKINCK